MTQGRQRSLSQSDRLREGESSLATPRLPRGYPEATPRLPRGYPHPCEYEHDSKRHRPREWSRGHRYEELLEFLYPQPARQAKRPPPPILFPPNKKTRYVPLIPQPRAETRGMVPYGGPKSAVLIIYCRFRYTMMANCNSSEGLRKVS